MKTFIIALVVIAVVVAVNGKNVGNPMADWDMECLEKCYEKFCGESNSEDIECAKQNKKEMIDCGVSECKVKRGPLMKVLNQFLKSEEGNENTEAPQ